MSEFYLSSCGAGQIHCRRWEPNDKPRAILQIVHGIAEHIGRYDDFARFLTAQGFLVTAEDHMGHGGSIGSDGTPGLFTGGWCAAVDDTYQLTQRTMEAYPDVPYFLFGHSMGSFMTRTLLIRYPDLPLAGAVICGTGWQPAAALKMGLAICRQEIRRHGETYCSPLAKKLMFGSYNRRIPNAQSEHDWICSDPQVVTRYTNDPMCGFDPTIGLCRDLLTGITMIQDLKNLQKMNQSLPIFLIAGDQDPVGNYGRGVQKTQRAFCSTGMTGVQCRLYPGMRHEILNEVGNQTVYNDVLQWLNNCLTATKYGI